MSSTPCQYYLRPGGCTRGDNCLFSHSRDFTSQSFSSPWRSSPIGPSSRAPNVFGPCKFFIQSRCTKGSSCPFLHIATSSIEVEKNREPESASLVDQPKTSPLASEPCRFYIRGVCSKGSACPFSHATKIVDSPMTRIPCSFYSKGICKKGDSCAFSHDRHNSASPSTSAVPGGLHTDVVSEEQRKDPLENFRLPMARLGRSNEAIAPAEEQRGSSSASTDDIFDRNMLCCKVTFENGASIQNITTSFESRSILLSNLPSSVTQAELIDLLEAFGHLESVVIDDASSNACAKFSSVSQASAAARGLHKIKFKHRTVLAKMDMKAVESGEATLRSTKVKVSWYSPGRVAWAHYKTISEARTHVRRLKGAVFSDRLITATFQAPSFRQTSSFSIELKGLPTDVELDHLKTFCMTHSVTLGEVFYDRQSSLQDVEDLLRRFGSIDAFEALPMDQKQPKITAFAQFADAERAAETVKQLHNKPQHFLHYTPIWLENIHSVKYSIPFLHFLAIKVPLCRLRDDCKDCKIRFYERDEVGRPVDDVCIRVFGTDPKSLGRVKTKLEPFLRGDPLLDDAGKVVWDDYFVVDEGKAFLADIGQKTKTFLQCDPRQRTISIFGEYKDIEPSAQAVLHKIRALEAEKHIVPLDKSMVRMLVQGGFRRLEQLVGENKLVVDVVARTLTVRSNDIDLERVKVALAAQGVGHLPSGDLSTNHDAVSCPVCYCEVADQTPLPCGHCYCKDCLRHLLQAAAESTLPSPKCVYEDSGKPCGAAIPNVLIRTLLSPDQEARLYEASFLAYIHSRPSEFKYCPTPDCRVVYRPAPDAVLRCPSCLDRICAACHVRFHEGLTCAEHQDDLGGGIDAFKKWKEENGVKSCPGCKADLQKAGGCNHMHCTRCGTHICWVCMKTFGDQDTEGGVYNHIRVAHGGYN